jgi:NAD(P)-dependent dehydrogenase (short-subunit alcohol dehydrogenase family)
VAVALVTGANTGIGYAIAERLVRDGLALAYATQAQGEKYREAYEQLAALGTVHWVAGDLTDAAVPQRLVSETVAALGSIDVLVNNAGLSTAKPALELTAEDFDRTFAVDVKAAFLLAQAAARAMGGRGGSIVNITSVHEHIPRANFSLYAAAKAALGMLTRGLALELAPLGIRVNAVAPGVVATPRNVQDARALDAEVPLGRPGTPEEVASAVSYLASEEASYVTGASFVVDGGMIQQVVTEPAG